MKYLSIKIVFINLLLVLKVLSIAAQKTEVKNGIDLDLHVHGIYDSKVTLTPFNGRLFANPVAELSNVSDSATINLPASYLPGQFVLRFDYRKQKTDDPYPSEIWLYLNKNDIKISVNPSFISKDSLKIENDPENKAYELFAFENQKKREQIGILEQVGAGYKDHHSKFYQLALKEFGQSLTDYNQWLDHQQKEQKELFISHSFAFQKLLPVDWQTSEKERLQYRIDNYFNSIDFSDSLIIRFQQINEFLSGYMNLYGLQMTSDQLRDSLMVAAGERACELASKGHPLVYGWMVDYFYQGYESYNIPKGMEMLKKHIDNPNCLTSKKKDINFRLKGMESLTTDIMMPGFYLQDAEGKLADIYQEDHPEKYRLLVFWSADCDHCRQLFEQLFAWWQKPENHSLVAITTIDLGGNQELWKSRLSLLTPEALHLIEPAGIKSLIAKSYFVLATPTMYLTTPQGKIELIPRDFNELNSFFDEALKSKK